MRKVVKYWSKGVPDLSALEREVRDVKLLVIRVKNLTQDFIDFVLRHSDVVHLHVVVTGMGGTLFEPCVFSVKNTFFAMKQLIDSGFSKRQLTVVIENLPRNDRGIAVLRLMLKIFTEFRDMGMIMRYLRIYQLGNDRGVEELREDPGFGIYLSQILPLYSGVIEVDMMPRYVVGQHELSSVGLNNIYVDEGGVERRYVTYRGRRIVDGVKFLGSRYCENKCVLCDRY